MDKNREHHLDWALGKLLTERNQFLAKQSAIKDRQLRIKLLGGNVSGSLSSAEEKIDWIPFPVKEFPEKPVRVLNHKTPNKRTQSTGVPPVPDP